MIPDPDRHVRKARSSRPWARMVARVLREKGTICHLCGQAGATSADHIVPVALGGRTEISNCEPVHEGCNYRRGTKSVEQARAEIAGHGPLPPEGEKWQLPDGRWLNPSGVVTSRDW